MAKNRKLRKKETRNGWKRQVEIEGDGAEIEELQRRTNIRKIKRGGHVENCR